MSLVSNVILTFSLSEHEDDEDDPNSRHEVVRQVEAFLDERERFVRVDGYCGGYKAFEAVAYLCAFNYLDEPNLILAISKAQWIRPESVQVTVRRQQQDRFERLWPRDPDRPSPEPV